MLSHFGGKGLLTHEGRVDRFLGDDVVGCVSYGVRREAREQRRIVRVSFCPILSSNPAPLPLRVSEAAACVGALVALPAVRPTGPSYPSHRAGFVLAYRCVTPFGTTSTGRAVADLALMMSAAVLFAVCELRIAGVEPALARENIGGYAAPFLVSSAVREVLRPVDISRTMNPSPPSFLDVGSRVSETEIALRVAGYFLIESSAN